MSKGNGRVSMDDMELEKTELPAAPIAMPALVPPPAPAAVEPEPEPEVEQGREVVNAAGIYIPPTENKEPLVAWSCRMPLRLRTLLEEIADEYKTDMTKIVVDLLEIHLPKIPLKKKRK